MSFHNRKCNAVHRNVNLPQVNVSRVNTAFENKHGHKLNFSISIPNQTDKTTMIINYVMTLILFQCLRLKKDIVCGRSKGPNERTALSYWSRFDWQAHEHRGSSIWLCVRAWVRQQQHLLPRWIPVAQTRCCSHYCAGQERGSVGPLLYS